MLDRLSDFDSKALGTVRPIMGGLGGGDGTGLIRFNIGADVYPDADLAEIKCAAGAAEIVRDGAVDSREGDVVDSEAATRAEVASCGCAVSPTFLSGLDIDKSGTAARGKSGCGNEGTRELGGILVVCGNSCGDERTVCGETECDNSELCCGQLVEKDGDTVDNGAWGAAHVDAWKLSGGVELVERKGEIPGNPVWSPDDKGA